VRICPSYFYTSFFFRVFVLRCCPIRGVALRIIIFNSDPSVARSILLEQNFWRYRVMVQETRGRKTQFTSRYFCKEKQTVKNILSIDFFAVGRRRSIRGFSFFAWGPGEGVLEPVPREWVYVFCGSQCAYVHLWLYVWCWNKYILKVKCYRAWLLLRLGWRRVCVYCT
jgi:hypothetical protein